MWLLEATRKVLCRDAVDPFAVRARTELWNQSETAEAWRRSIERARELWLLWWVQMTPSVVISFTLNTRGNFCIALSQWVALSAAQCELCVQCHPRQAPIFRVY